MNPALHHGSLSHSQAHSIRHALPRPRSRPPAPNPYTYASNDCDESSLPYAIAATNNYSSNLPPGSHFEVSPAKRQRLASFGLDEGGRARNRTTELDSPQIVLKASPSSRSADFEDDEGNLSRPTSAAAAAAPATPVIVQAQAIVTGKSRRVRTGCLTCRERHLKCDEGLPDCVNCRKSNRECKRGVRLNFIDIQVKDPPRAPTLEWSIHFQDESRLIASEYKGGLGRYPRPDPKAITPPRETDLDAALRRHSLATSGRESSISSSAPRDGYNHHHAVSGQLPSVPVDYGENQLAQMRGVHSRKGSPNPTSFSSTAQHDQYATRDDIATRTHTYRGSDVSSVASVAQVQATGPAVQNPRPHTGNQGAGQRRAGTPDGLMTPPSEKIGGERDYLSTDEEIRFMQVFIDEVAIWMDSLDSDKHFTNMTPYLALKSPMLLNAFLACGVKHLTLVEDYSDEKALFYYDTATTQLLRCLQNPDRNMDECATTAVVLNVYEIMSEKPTQRMNHIAGARALIRECGWNATTTGIGAACFWLNIGMEVLSCLAFNWQTAWDPDQWGLDLAFTSWTAAVGAGQESAPGGKDRDMQTGAGEEELWAHRIFYIVAKIANFRANIPRFQEPSPHDEQVRLQSRFAEWKRLKAMCDGWDNTCPRPMRPYGYSHSLSSKSLFPNVWLIKRPAVIGRLFYHTAMCLLAQINPLNPRDSEENRAAQLHHAHQVCGIVAHTKDRGVASIALRSLAIAGCVLTDRQEQTEVLTILDKINKETGWRLGKVLLELKTAWGWESESAALQFFTASSHQQQQQQRQKQKHEQQQQHQAAVMAAASTPPMGAPTPARPNVNPLLVNADFTHRNHPYQNWYEPPNRTKPTNMFNAQQGLWP
ncbi:hypothetical protein B0T17DRAFT_618072 [Bombardia bombarda]|uniref:Zn(2)-C6 fungal-type domain-containing protein n=1 Tax=Bombardia bombarda TaxID=252184 RepID=A0AA39WU34_9PEZI|nr:hypothetical protein B0T17DRAFT_618072 [Bombardia bombarda]